MMIPDLRKECVELKNEFDTIRKTYQKFFNDLDENDYTKLLDKINDPKITKIVWKLLKFPGDISINMLIKLGEALESLKGQK